MDQRVQSLLDNRRNIFITGPGGVGKSYTTRAIIDSLLIDNRSVLTCAYTGVAALNIGGTTLHSLLGQGLFTGTVDLLAEKMISMLRRNKINDIAKRWIDCEVLIIDEISMMDVSLFIRASSVISRFRREAQRMGLLNEDVAVSSPWGGIQLVLVGDFLQLPPIEKYKDGDTTYTYIFEHPIWNEMYIETIYLTTSRRYGDDDEYFSILNDIRLGIYSDRVKNMIKSCSIPPKMIRCSSGEMYIKPTILYPTNREVDSLNESELDRLDGIEKTYHMKFTCSHRLIRPSIAIDDMIKHMPIPRVSRFRIGCQVMLMKNMLHLGLCNGSRGVLVRYTDDDIPVVEFDNGVITIIDYTTREMKKTFYDNDVKEVQTGTLEYIPLKLAYAMSIHKSQGQTCSSVLVSASQIFGSSMLYVALSRCKDRKRLYINGYSDKVFERSHPNLNALSFYENL